MSREHGKGKSRVGAFFGGSFFGFILCLALIAGVGLFAYFKVSPAWINKTFKTEIDLGSDEANNKTLNEFVKSAVSLANNVDTYTLNNLKGDFGIEIKDEMFGLDITDLKDVGLKELPDAIKNKFSTISADELKKVIDLDNMQKVLDNNNIYYYNKNDNKLYKSFDGTTYSNPVDFEFETNSNNPADVTKIITKKHESDIVLNQEHGIVNQVNIPLWYLPLTSALGDFTSNMGNQITLKDLEEDYGVKLPSFFDNVDKENTTINEMEEEINNLYVADFLDYSLDSTNPSNVIVKDKLGNTVTGVMSIVAKVQVKNLSGLKTTIEDTQVFEILDLKYDNLSTSYFDDKDKDGVKDAGEELAPVMSIIATTKVKDLTTKINTLKLEDIFTEGELGSGALSLIPSTTLVTNIAKALNEEFKTLTLGELIDKKVVELDTSAQVTYNNKKDLYVAGTSTQVKNLLLEDLITLALDSIPTTNTPLT